MRGRFDDFEGTIQLDEANPAGSSVDFTIQAASIDTNEPDRDKHLRSEDFFAVEQFKTITFTSKRITKRGAEAYDVGGDLTIRGVTKEVTLPVTHLGKAKDPWGNEKIGFETEITLNRKDYELKWNAPLETGLLVSTHILQEVDAIADRVIVIHNGRLVFDGTPRDLGDHASLEQHFYELTLGGAGRPDGTPSAGGRFAGARGGR